MPPLDSPVLFDGDSGFRALVTRSRASQLKPGEVAVSKNMRFEESGTAKVREGYDNVSGVILSQNVFPFLVSEAGTAAIVLIGVISSCTATASGTTVTVVCPAPHGIPATGGIVNLASFTGGTGDFLGNRKATYISANNFSVQVAGISGSWTGGVVGAAKLTRGSQAIY